MPAVIGCDAQKQFSVFVTLDGKTSPAVRVDHPRQEYVDFLSSLPPGSEIALEATGHWYWMVDEMEKSVHHRHLAKPTEAKKRMVVLFFLVAQLVAKLQFHQSLSKPIYFGGAFVVTGGLIMTLWKG